MHLVGYLVCAVVTVNFVLGLFGSDLTVAVRVPCWSQVDDLIDAAKGEGIGTHVKGALDRVVKASEETLQALNAATSL